jgi:hypothetical protein
VSRRASILRREGAAAALLKNRTSTLTTTGHQRKTLENVILKDAIEGEATCFALI